MISIKRTLLGAVFAVVIAGSAHAATINDVTLQQDAKGSTVLIAADAETDYAVYDLSERVPARVILTFPGTRLAASARPTQAAASQGIRSVSTEQTAKGVRVEIVMAQKEAYKVIAQGNDLLVRFASPAAAGQAKAQPAKDEAALAAPDAAATARAGRVAVGLKASSLGVGLEIVTGLTPHLNLRGVVNGFRYSRNATHNTIDYHAQLNLFSAGAILDFMPAAHGRFRLSLGGLYDGNKLDLSGRATGGNYVINGVSYTAAQAGTVSGSVQFDKFAPYVGLGYGNAIADSGWSISFDAGVLYQGTPRTSLSATGIAAGLATNVAAERIKLQNSLKNDKWWPVLSLGMDYSF